MGLTGRIFTVSEITAEIKALLERRFDLIWITGEISNFSAPLSGHVYFTLKDDRAQIRCVMFRGQNRALRFRPEDGMEVTGMGRISLYEPRGAYQVIFEYLEPKGLGALQKAFEQLKAKLADEGLFDASHKKPLPFLPERIALVTSPSGAAVHDFLRIALQRFPSLVVDVVPVQVQGNQAATEIASALELLQQWRRSDVIVLARGGGSLEDLQAFNTEIVARAIFQSRIPVVSAVGHETDYTIADFVADMRAPTPSAAAEQVVPSRRDLLGFCDESRRRLRRSLTGRIEALRQSLAYCNRRLAHPRRRIDDLRLRVDDLSGRMIRAGARLTRRRRDQIVWQLGRLTNAGPQKQIIDYKLKNKHLYKNLLNSISKNIFKNRSFLQELDGRLSALSPLAVLERGYSITRAVPGNRVVMDPATVRRGQRLRITLARGDLAAAVTDEKPPKQGQ
jgi:exodeoxyribonuclease VII large subunit